MAKGNESDTPMMQQYRAAKEAHPGMLLLFRMGDFFETFAEDAEMASRVLGLTLTSRDKAIPMAGFPHHQLENYLRKLLQQAIASPFAIKSKTPRKRKVSSAAK